MQVRGLGIADEDLYQVDVIETLIIMLISYLYQWVWMRIHMTTIDLVTQNWNNYKCGLVII
ncbi:MAG: hypothetical protein CML60_02225 [Rhodobacteraceae bacterium]|nr:hypothetical protein [Paracoccaceae bacterium]